MCFFFFHVIRTQYWWDRDLKPDTVLNIIFMLMSLRYKCWQGKRAILYNYYTGMALIAGGLFSIAFTTAVVYLHSSWGHSSTSLNRDERYLTVHTCSYSCSCVFSHLQPRSSFTHPANCSAHSSAYSFPISWLYCFSFPAPSSAIAYPGINDWLKFYADVS